MNIAFAAELGNRAVHRNPAHYGNISVFLRDVHFEVEQNLDGLLSGSKKNVLCITLTFYGYKTIH